MLLIIDIPLDFMAINSQFSERVPYVVNEARSIDKGKTRGTNLGEKYIKNLPIVKISKPFPASSSMYNQKV